MFDNSTVFVLLKENGQDKICKLEVDEATQKEINGVFNSSAKDMVKKERIPFTGSYTPLEDEALVIANYSLSDELKDAFRNPVLVESFRPSEEEIRNIRALCVGFCEESDQGETFTAAFQRLRKDQYIAIDKIRLLFDRNTFLKDQRIGLAIGEYVDCVLKGEELIFTSYYYARQIFDLSRYYRIANDADVDRFIGAKVLDFGNNAEQFKTKTNNWVRRKIALINDSGVLDRFSAAQIKKMGKAVGIEIQTENRKIVFPTDYGEMKVLLSFLDEEAYQGPFSKDTFLSTSKRRVPKG